MNNSRSFTNLIELAMLRRMARLVVDVDKTALNQRQSLQLILQNLRDVMGYRQRRLRWHLLREAKSALGTIVWSVKQLTTTSTSTTYVEPK